MTATIPVTGRWWVLYESESRTTKDLDHYWRSKDDPSGYRRPAESWVKLYGRAPVVAWGSFALERNTVLGPLVAISGSPVLAPPDDSFVALVADHELNPCWCEGERVAPLNVESGRAYLGPDRRLRSDPDWCQLCAGVVHSESESEVVAELAHIGEGVARIAEQQDRYFVSNENVMEQVRSSLEKLRLGITS